MTHARRTTHEPRALNALPNNGAATSVVSGAWFASEKAAHAWVRKLDQMDNEQLADVLGFIFCKLCKR
jgi:hypothetical protein